jgi:hypothetical protein
MKVIKYLFKFDSIEYGSMGSYDITNKCWRWICYVCNPLTVGIAAIIIGTTTRGCMGMATLLAISVGVFAFNVAQIIVCEKVYSNDMELIMAQFESGNWKRGNKK